MEEDSRLTAGIESRPCDAHTYLRMRNALKKALILFAGASLTLRCLTDSSSRSALHILSYLILMFYLSLTELGRASKAGRNDRM